MSANVELSVVIAVQHAGANLNAIEQALTPKRFPQVEFLFVFAGEPSARTIKASNVIDLQSADNSLIPLLWRDGMRAAKAERIAVTTAHCIPAENWVESCLALDMKIGCAGVGGVIDNDPASDAPGWAIFFQRYINYASPQQARDTHEIAADNALYQRSNIFDLPELLETGFWEPDFHHHFRAQGSCLRLEPTLRVIHHNRYTAWQFFRQRIMHGHNFGHSRAQHLSIPMRLVYFLGSPLIPLVILQKIVSRVWRQGQYRGKLLLALPWLLFFVSGWSIGEARGCASSLIDPCA